MPVEAERLTPVMFVPEMPPEKVEVAVEVLSIDPPEMVKPFADTRPPPATVTPELVKVEVAVDEL
jgi:hypothetical protein